MEVDAIFFFISSLSGPRDVICEYEKKKLQWEKLIAVKLRVDIIRSREGLVRTVNSSMKPARRWAIADGEREEKVREML